MKLPNFCIKAMRTNSQKLKAHQKKAIFGSELHNCKNNIRKTWDIIKSLLPKKSAKQPIQMLEAGDGTVVHEPKLAQFFKF